MFRAPLTPPAAVLLTAGLFLLTACGTTPAGQVRTDSRASAAPSVPASAQPSVPASAQPSVPVDARLAEVAERCRAAGTATPTPTGVLPTDPEAAKYAENHAFKQQAPLSAEGKCRGDAHAARIRTALAAAAAPRTPEELTGLLRGLGYPVGPSDVYAGSGSAGPGFTLWVPDRGPCLSALPDALARVEAHGPYMEGGCREPRGGH
ncbi:hypothetical protein OOK31_26900 [Streptomyces sp. NBC_00249]|uniref:hypothetical protein n=1 Tax=Streptomyces sp. NBC_00249 TaxID=2975690 RepID=UPI00225ABA06|nr:hypothetical protein [Streptomyces sp. NBC_00249]MCX5197482.1 hypothetical protein [Streptomyces sp. NBC_00249]